MNSSAKQRTELLIDLQKRFTSALMDLRHQARTIMQHYDEKRVKQTQHSLQTPAPKSHVTNQN